MAHYHQNSKKPYSKQTAYINLNSYNYNSQPIDTLNTIFSSQWNIMSLQISSHGSNGVLFIQTTIGSFVLKMNNQAPSDLFFNMFAQLLDVNVPEVKIIACYEDFFQLLTFKIQQFCEKDQQLSARLRKRMDFPFYQLMEYIPSVSFLQVGKQRFEKFLIDESKLQSIGVCIGFDMITNNSDRFKLSKIWSSLSEGNVANVLIQVPNHYMHNMQKIKDRQQLSIALDQYWFIDHSGFLLDIQNNKLASDNFHKYMQKVCLFQQQMIQFIRNQLPLPEQFQGLTKQIEFFTKHTLNEGELTHVIEGIIYSTSMFISSFEQGVFENVLAQLHRNNSQQYPNREQVKYWDHYWNSDLNKIKLKHLQVYHLKVSAIYATYSQVINSITDKVAKNMEKRQNHHNKPPSSLRNNKRSKSKNSNNPQPIKQQPKINLDFLKDQQQQEDNYPQNNNHHPQQLDEKQKQLIRKQQQNQIKQQLKRKRLKQRLQAFQKQNYQQQSQQSYKK